MKDEIKKIGKGNLYLTSIGIVVLGGSKYFTDFDEVIYTFDELKAGIDYNNFIERISKIRRKQNAEGLPYG